MKFLVLSLRMDLESSGPKGSNFKVVNVKEDGFALLVAYPTDAL